MPQIHNQHKHLEKRRLLRSQLPPAEIILWKRLQNSQIGGAKFRRQHGINQFVLDFYCPEVHLALELDGPSHHSEDAFAYDTQRQQLIESCGVTFLRFSNQQIYKDIEQVVEAIFVKVEQLRALKR